MISTGLEGLAVPRLAADVAPVLPALIGAPPGAEVALPFAALLRPATALPCVAALPLSATGTAASAADEAAAPALDSLAASTERSPDAELSAAPDALTPAALAPVPAPLPPAEPLMQWLHRLLAVPAHTAPTPAQSSSAPEPSSSALLPSHTASALPLATPASTPTAPQPDAGLSSALPAATASSTFAESIARALIETRALSGEGRAESSALSQAVSTTSPATAAAAPLPTGFTNLLGSVAALTTAPTDPTLASAPVAMDQPDWPERLGAQIQWRLGEGVQEARVALNPRELGAVEVRLSMDDSGLRVHLTAAQADTRELLQQELPRLREALQQGGLQLADAQVGRESSGREPPRQPQARESRLAQPDEEASGGGAAGGWRQRRGLLDDYA